MINLFNKLSHIYPDRCINFFEALAAQIHTKPTPRRMLFCVYLRSCVMENSESLTEVYFIEEQKVKILFS